MSAARETHRSTWRAPLIIGASSVLGLVSALLGDGAWDVLSWFALGLPLWVIAKCLHRARSAAE